MSGLHRNNICKWLKLDVITCSANCACMMTSSSLCMYTVHALSLENVVQFVKICDVAN